MGIPFNVIMGGTAARMYKSLGYTDGQITVALGSIGVAWSLKPLWAAFLDMYRTKRFFVLTMEIAVAVLLACVAMSLPAPGFFRISIALFWAAAFASSTQDICGDGVYLASLVKPVQARLAGVQGTFWVLGKVLATGVFISVLDRVRAARGWPALTMWNAVLMVTAGSMVLLAAYHFFFLPSGGTSERRGNAGAVVRNFLGTAATFFDKRSFWGMMAFVFLFRLGEGLILMEGPLFLQSAVSKGGLGLTAGEVSSIDAIWGTVFSIAGGLLGGMFASRLGLARCLVILGLSLNVPHFTYVALSQLAASGHGVPYGSVVALVCLEKFGYGFGFVGNMIYMMQQLAPGRSAMTHYAFATSLMNLMLVPTNMISGPLAEWLGFSTFFLVVMFASVPSAWAAFKAPFPLGGTSGGTGDAESSQRVTIDDPSRLGAGERSVQRSAGRASIYAMLNVLMLLIVDAKILGSLEGAPPGSGRFQLALLAGSAALKGFLTVRSLRHGAAARAQALAIGETAYAGNARGARIATLLCAAASCAVVAFAAWRVLGR